MKRLLCLVLLLATTVFADPKPLGKLTVTGVAPGMALDDVMKRLGKPTDTLGTEDQTYQLTYDKGGGGHDPIVIFVDKKVAFVEGESLESDGKVILKIGATRQEAEDVLGKPEKAPQGGSSQSGGVSYSYFELLYDKVNLHVLTTQAGNGKEIVQYFNIGNRDI